MSPLALSVRFLQTQPDRRLIELARAGHERAFEALVQRYRRALLRYCCRMTPSEATAEDVLQQALMQAWVALGNQDVEVRDARAWLYRIVHNAAISQLRRPVHDSLEASHTGLARGTEDELDRRLEAFAALAGLASLPDLQREVMLSTALEGRSHDEVADALGLSHGAVRGLIYRARATLRAAAAALIPSPLVHWAARQGPGTGRSGAVVEALAGGGSVGIGGLIVKGGAVVAAAGAIATAAGIADHGAQRHAQRIEARKPARLGAHRGAASRSAVTAAFTRTSASSSAVASA
jgi:RNA polymerase sigma factor (sigma-70 family)